jgi:hypothetical protein
MQKYKYVLLLWFSTTVLYAQEFSNKAIKTGIGIADLSSDHAEGFGWNASVGFQKSFWANRVRLCPNLSFGTLTTAGYTGLGDAYYNTLGVNTDAYLNIVRVKSVSIFIGGGLFANSLTGLKETGMSRSEYVKRLYAGWSACGGLRVAPPKWRMAMELIPFAYYSGHGFELYTTKLQLDIRLNKKQGL